MKLPWKFFYFVQERREQERGRENRSFPAVEILKPQGFKEFHIGGTSEILSSGTK
jgi:hypothetical protein